MLFELYSVPRVTYAIDALMSFAHNHTSIPPEGRDGLAVSFNTASTHVIPILNGKGILSRTKRYHTPNLSHPLVKLKVCNSRLPFGGGQAAQFLVKLLQLKHPTFPAQSLLAVPQNGNVSPQPACRFFTYR